MGLQVVEAFLVNTSGSICLFPFGLCFSLSLALSMSPVNHSLLSQVPSSVRSSTLSPSSLELSLLSLLMSLVTKPILSNATDFSIDAIFVTTSRISWASSNASATCLCSTAKSDTPYKFFADVDDSCELVQTAYLIKRLSFSELASSQSICNMSLSMITSFLASLFCNPSINTWSFE